MSDLVKIKEAFRPAEWLPGKERFPKPEIRSLEPETRNPKPGTQNQEHADYKGCPQSHHMPLWFHRNVQWFRGGLVCQAHKLFYDSVLGVRVIQKKKKQQVAQKALRTKGGIKPIVASKSLPRQSDGRDRSVWDSDLVET